MQEFDLLPYVMTCYMYILYLQVAHGRVDIFMELLETWNSEIFRVHIKQNPRLSARHAEYLAVSVKPPELHRRHHPRINAIAASRAGSQSEALFTRTFWIDKGGQPGSYCLSLTMRWWLPTSLLKITHCHRSICTLYTLVLATSCQQGLNSSSRHALSAMYPVVMSIVWQNDTIYSGRSGWPSLCRI
jgi:hypothetical protein